jgi:hypothetical protein
MPARDDGGSTKTPKLTMITKSRLFVVVVVVEVFVNRRQSARQRAYS